MHNSSEARQLVSSNPLWYHTMELAPGVVTPGWFDLRPVVDDLPWPDLRGQRCLDIGTFDGFLAFEMERRGAAEVICTDIPSHADWDHLPRQRAQALEYWAENAGAKGEGFRIAAKLLDSKVEREWINIYDLSPERLGTFDVVVCGALLLHLSAPFRALEAILSVCRTNFLSAEQIDVKLSLTSRKRPAIYLEGEAGRWGIANVAAHRRMLEIAGFDIVQKVDPYVVPFGAGHDPTTRLTIRDWARAGATKMLCGSMSGVPYSAVLARKVV
jgi:tRNA (mo5U34)-methyltransferase